MRKLAIAIPATKPRNAVVRALVHHFSMGAGRHKAKHQKRAKSVADIDLAQRVREVGEW